jgi:hypothetical protein
LRNTLSRTELHLSALYCGVLRISDMACKAFKNALGSFQLGDMNEMESHTRLGYAMSMYSFIWLYSSLAYRILAPRCPCRSGLPRTASSGIDLDVFDSPNLWNTRVVIDRRARGSKPLESSIAAIKQRCKRK